MRWSDVDKRAKRYAARQFVSDIEIDTGGRVLMPVGERAQGVIKFFNTDKGFGFCQREGGSDVFVHANELRRSGFEGFPKEGERLEFDVIPVIGKAPKASNIKRL